MKFNPLSLSGFDQTGDTLPAQSGHAGQFLTTDGITTSWAANGSGSVTSVGLSLPASILSVSGSPVTTSGTLTGTLTTQTANTIWAGPTTGIASAPTFRSLVSADLPTGNTNTGAFYNASGVLTSDADFRFINTTKSMAFVALSAGGTTTSTGSGSLTHGAANNGGQLNATATGSIAHGFSNGTGSPATSKIEATGTGAIATGIAAAPGNNFITANAGGSVAIGDIDGGSNITASGRGSLAGGRISNTGNITASGNGATSRGFILLNGNLSATGDGATSSGYVLNSPSVITASGEGSFAVGYNGAGVSINASGRGSFAGGYGENGNTTSSGKASFSFGDLHTNSADFGSAFGKGNLNSSYSSLIIGRYGDASGTATSWVSTDPVFIAGNGTGTGARDYAFKILKDGTTYIKDPSLTGSSVGYVWTLQNTTTGAGAWGAPALATNKKEVFILSGTDITNQYIDVTQVARTDSIDFIVRGGGIQMEGASYDYSVSYTGGAGSKTRITFLNDLATGGASALVAGDIICVKYEY